MTFATAHTQKQTTTLDLSFALRGPALRRLLGLLTVLVRLAFHPELLPQLKGPQLSVLLALALRANNERTCFPSVTTIAKDTGYGRSSVIAALDKLEDLGLVTRTRRQRKSTLYEVMQYDAKAASVQQAKASLQQNKRERPAPAQPGKGPKSDGQHKTQAMSGKLEDSRTDAKGPKTGPETAQSTDSRHKQVVVNKTIKGPILEPQPVVRVHQIDFEEWLGVKEALKKQGIAEEIAVELIEQQHEKGRGPSYITSWLAAYQDGIRTKRINSAGWLISALRYDWALPRAFENRRENIEDPREKYLKGEYADIVMH